MIQNLTWCKCDTHTNTHDCKLNTEWINWTFLLINRFGEFYFCIQCTAWMWAGEQHFAYERTLLNYTHMMLLFLLMTMIIAVVHRSLLCSSTGNEFQFDRTHMISLQVHLIHGNCVRLCVYTWCTEIVEKCRWRRDYANCTRNKTKNTSDEALLMWLENWI